MMLKLYEKYMVFIVFQYTFLLYFYLSVFNSTLIFFPLMPTYDRQPGEEENEIWHLRNLYHYLSPVLNI